MTHRPSPALRLKQLSGRVDIWKVTQPKGAQPAPALVAAVQNASRAALVMSVAAVSLVGAGAAVAVDRTAGSSRPASSAVAAPAITSAAPALPASPAPSSSPVSAPARQLAERAEARSLLARAFADALAERTVHARTRAVYRGIGTAYYDNRAAHRGGIQHLAIYGGHVAIRVIGPATYYNGDRLGLIRFLLYSQADAAAFNQRWVRLTRGQRGYGALTAGVTLASLLREDHIGGPLRLLPQRRVNGVRAVGVRGRATGSKTSRHSVATMWVTTGNHPLPVKYIEKSRRLLITQTFSAWGRPVHLETPRGAVRVKAHKP